MSEDENVKLLEAGSRLRGQIQEAGPIFRQLGIVDGVVQLQSLLQLPVSPPWIKSNKNNNYN